MTYEPVSQPPASVPPPSYKVLAWASAAVGMVPMALVALYHAYCVRPAWEEGYPITQSEALKHSRKAKHWAIATLVVGAALWTVAGIMIATN